MGLLDTADACAVATYKAGISSGQRAGHCKWPLFAESTEALCQHLSRSGKMEMVRLLCVWSLRLHASASYCILLPYNTTTDDSSILLD